jgi:hypothetical protein
MSPPMKKHLELEIKTLQNAPRDVDKLERLLKIKKGKNRKQYIHRRHKKIKES